MFLNNQLKIISKKTNQRIIQTDNFDAYLTISDFNNINDGLWYNGFQIFNSINIENGKKIDCKILYPANMDILFSNKFLINLTLLKKGNGLIIEIINKKIISKSHKTYFVNFNLNEKNQILEKNIKNIILEYSDNKKNSSESKKIYWAIAINIDYNFDDIKNTKEGICFSLNSLEKSAKEAEFYIFYHNDYNELKNILEININKINILKKEHLKKSLLPIKYTNCQTDDKTINKALLWSIVSSTNFIYYKNIIYDVLSGIPENLNFQTINTLNSLAGITLTTGLLKKARNILYSISKFQCTNKASNDYGRIPDFIGQSKKLNYLLEDSTPLFIRSIYEYYLYTGNHKFIILMLPIINSAIEKVYFLNKDKKNFFIQNKKRALSNIENYQNSIYLSRGDYSIETQVLWYTALHCASNILKKITRLLNKKMKKDKKNELDLLNLSKKYKEEANKLKDHFIKFFISKKPPFIYDHLNAGFSQINETSLFPILAIYYSTLPGIPTLIDKRTGINFINFLILNYFSKEIKNHNKNSEIELKFWLFNIFVGITRKYGFKKLIPDYLTILSRQILDKDTLGTLNDHAYKAFIENDNVKKYENFSSSSAISEFTRSFYQDYLGIKMNIADRKIYIEPTYLTEINNIDANIKFGISESLFYHARFNKKYLNVSFIEIRGLKIIKPLVINLKIYLGIVKAQEKLKYNYMYIKFKLNKIDDMLRISFEQLKENLIKIKDLSTSGSSIIYNLKNKSEVLDESIDFEFKPFKY